MLEEISGERTMSVDAINFSSEPSVFCGSQSNGCMRGLDMVLDKRDLDANKRTEDKLSFANIKLIGTYFHEQGHFMAKMRLIKYITTKQQVFHELEATLFEATAAKKFGRTRLVGSTIFENALDNTGTTSTKNIHNCKVLTKFWKSLKITTESSPAPCGCKNVNALIDHWF